MKAFTVFAICLTILVVSGNEAAKAPPKPGATEAPKAPQQKGTTPTTPKSSQSSTTLKSPSSEDDSSSSEEHSRLHHLLKKVPHAVGHVVGGKLELVSDVVDRAVDITQGIVKQGTEFISQTADKIRPHDHKN